MSSPDLARRQRLRHAAVILTFTLREHPDLPVLTWTVTPDFLRGHVDVCDLEPGRDRQVFTAWANALAPSAYPDPDPVLDTSGTTHLRANRYVNGLAVILTATVHPSSRQLTATVHIGRNLSPRRSATMLDRVQSFYGFTRMPFGRDLAPGMLHPSPAPGPGRPPLRPDRRV